MDLATVDHLLTTTRSVRKRLDLDRPWTLISSTNAWKSPSRRPLVQTGKVGGS